MFVQLAEEYRKEGLLENAVEICEEGLKKHPHYPSARVALGRALLESESFGRAAEEFETVLAQVPDNILANKFLGETYHRMGRLDEALQKYQIAQTLAPEDTELEAKIQAVRDESAGDPAPPPPSTEAAASELSPPGASTEAAASELPPPGASTEAAASELPQPPPLFDMPASAGSLPEPTPPMGMEDALETTFVEPPAASASPQLPEAPSLEPPAETLFEGESMVPEEPEPEPEPDLAPIPLVDVSEPMILEGPAYTAAENAAERSESEPTSTRAVEPSEAAPGGEQVFEIDEHEPPLTPAPSIEEPPSIPEPAFVEGPLGEAPVPLEPAPAAVPVMDEIETPTMAELYATQGHFDRAVAVYRNLLVRSPDEAQYRERIEELEMLATAAALPKVPVAPARSPALGEDGLSDESREKVIGALSGWLDAIRRSREA